MTQLIWLTDIHLDHVNLPGNRKFLDKVQQAVSPGDSVVITGDIAEGPSVREFMFAWRKGIADRGGKLYFVLGNHDFYRDSIVRVREAVRDLLGDCWLPEVKVADLCNGEVGLVGHDGWYDGLYASWHRSKLIMEDYKVILELGPLHCAHPNERFSKLQELAREAAAHVLFHGNEAAKSFKTVFVATHVPPFRENSVYNGKISDDTWMPHFSSKHMGDALLKLAGMNPKTEFVVLCGHTHGTAVHKAAHNLVCYTGFAEYKKPSIANIFTLA